MRSGGVLAAEKTGKCAYRRRLAVEKKRSDGVPAVEENRVPNGIYLLRMKCKKLTHVTLFFISHAPSPPTK